MKVQWFFALKPQTEILFILDSGWLLSTEQTNSKYSQYQYCPHSVCRRKPSGWWWWSTSGLWCRRGWCVAALRRGGSSLSRCFRTTSSSEKSSTAWWGLLIKNITTMIQKGSWLTHFNIYGPMFGCLHLLFWFLYVPQRCEVNINWRISKQTLSQSHYCYWQQ